MTFLIMCSIFMIDCAWAVKGIWNREYIKVFKIVNDNTILIKFKFLDYTFGPANEIGYLERCDFFYSSNSSRYFRFMRSETSNQNRSRCSWLNMMDKLSGVQLYFTECSVPDNGTFWSDNIISMRVEAKHPGDEAYASLKWILTKPYQKVKRIKVVGLWHVGINMVQAFIQFYDVVPIMSALKAELKTELNQKNVSAQKINQSIYNAAKVYSEADAVVIKGTNTGENINIYTMSGEQIKSCSANKDVINIKLPVNRIYIVHIGQTRYKVVL